jgi:hypothetical protein
MSNTWFFTQLPPSRYAIENELRLALWHAGFGGMWFTCTKEMPPFECSGFWSNQPFALEWEPRNYLLLKMAAPNQNLLRAFERALKHKPLAAYKNGDGSVVVEWRAQNANARFQELQSSGVADLQRLNK